MVAYSVAAGDRLPEVVAGVGTAGWVVTVVALAGRWPSLLPWGLAGVGACYAVFLGLRAGTVDPRAPFVAAAFFAAAELSFWSVERLESRGEGAVLVRRLLLIGSGALVTAVLGGLLLVLAAGVSAGLELEAIGVLAAVVTLVIVAGLAARASESTSA